MGKNVFPMTGLLRSKSSEFRSFFLQYFSLCNLGRGHGISDNLVLVLVRSLEVVAEQFKKYGTPPTMDHGLAAMDHGLAAF